MKTNYPDSVVNFARRMTEAVEDILGEEIGREEYENRCLEKCFEKFIKGEDFMTILEGSDIENVLRLAAADTIVNSLKKKGLIDSIEDENGKTIEFLTAYGKKAYREMNPEKDKNS
jgi:hypothetical protein